MGNFLETEEMRALTQNPELKMLDEEQLEMLYVGPAERELDERFNLEIDTNLYPSQFSGRMQSDSALAERFQADFKMATILLIERMAANPHGLKSESQLGASVSFGTKMPPAVSSLLRRWGRSGQVFRA